MPSEKYGRTHHYPFSPGTTSDDRIAQDYWSDLQRLKTLVHTEKLDGENNCLSRWGVFARSHAAPTTSPWTATLREFWQRIKSDLGDLEIFGENLYATHSIEYRWLEHHFFVFAVRDGDQWLSWEEVKFYAAMLDLPTVPELAVEPTPADKQAFESRVQSMVQWPGAFEPVDAFTQKPCTVEGIVSRNAGSFSTDAFAHNLFKWVRKGHVKTDEHWTRNWRRAPLKHEGETMWTLTENKDWNALRNAFDFVRDMESVVQDSVHHAEGDVAVHTRMVLDELQKLDGFRALSVQEQELLWTAALLHDVEKRSTTVREPDGCVTAKGHAKKGAMTARLLLYTQYNAPFNFREQIVNLVRYHGLPLWAIEKADPARAVIEASLVVNTQWLSLLARADALGRTCSDAQDLLYRIDLFEALCAENDCWGKARTFATPAARFQYFRKEESYPDFVPFDDFGSTVVLLSGLPGAGKDTYAFHHYRNWPVINLDAIRREHKISPTDKSGNGRVIQLAKEQARIYLRRKEDFVWNATNVTRSMREQVVDLFVTYKAFVKIVYVEVPYPVLHQQNKNREAVLHFGAVERLVTKLEIPAPWEAHEVMYCLKEG